MSEQNVPDSDDVMDAPRLFERTFPLLERAIDRLRMPPFDVISCGRFIRNPQVAKAVESAIDMAGESAGEEMLDFLRKHRHRDERYDFCIEMVQARVCALFLLGVWLGQQGLAFLPESDDAVRRAGGE